MWTERRAIPSLVDLCVQTAVDNVRYLGNVGLTEAHLLERILPHCTLEQLMHIENVTEGRDLSPITNKLWKNFYQRHFGAKNTDSVIENMKRSKVSYTWKQLYEAKTTVEEGSLQNAGNKLNEGYKKANARKQSRQIQLCSKVPPSSSKRSFYGGGPGSNISNTTSNLMKKTKREYLNSVEVKNLAAMKRTRLQNSHSFSSTRKPGGFSGNGSASSSKLTKPIGRKV